MTQVQVARCDSTTTILELDGSIFDPDEDPTELHYPETVWWVAYNGTLPVGYAGARPLPGADALYVCRMGVVPKWRGKGIQRRLLQQQVRFAKREGWAQLITYVHPANVWSLNNFVRCGFRFYLPEWAWAGEDFMYLMRPTVDREAA